MTDTWELNPTESVSARRAALWGKWNEDRNGIPFLQDYTIYCKMIDR